MSCMGVRAEKPVGATDGGRYLEVPEMSGETPRWLAELSQELGLEDTPLPLAEDKEISLLEAIKRFKFTPQGWGRVRELIVKAEDDLDPALFRRILSADDDDAMILTAMIALPYYLSRTLGHEEKLCDSLITYVAAAFLVAMARGYALGKADVSEAG